MLIVSKSQAFSLLIILLKKMVSIVFVIININHIML